MADKTQNIKINIKAETTKATDEIKKLNKEVSRLGKQNKGLKQTTQQVNQMSRSFASLTKHVSQLAIIYGVFQGLNTTIRTFANFEESVSRLGVISGATSKELSLMKDKAEELGASTIFTASQVADGMNAMAMAGLSAEQSMNGIGASLNLASIGMITVEQASLIATRAMNGFGLSSEDMNRISDVLAKTITSSALTITELGSALEKVSAVATTFGLSIEETSGALGVLGDAGRVGAEAGTQLKIVLSRLAGNKEAKKYLDELGISIYDASGNILPFITQLRNVKVELDKLPESARNIKMNEIFGSEAIVSANILLKNIDEMDSKINELGDSFGFASEKAKDMMDNLTGDFKEFNSALEGLIINLGEGLSPALRDILDNATEFLQSLDPEKVKEFGQDIGDLAQTGYELVQGIIILIDGVHNLSKSIEEFTGLSGASQVKLLLLGVAMGKLYKIGIGLQKSYLALKASTIGYELAQSVQLATTGKLTWATKILTVAQMALNKVILANPLAFFITAVTTATVAVIAWTKSTKDAEEAQKRLKDNLETNNEIISITKDSMNELGTSGREAFGGFIRDQIRKTTAEISKLKEAIDKEKNAFHSDKEKIIELEEQLAKHQESLKGLEEQEKLLVKVSREKKEALDNAHKATLQAIEDSKKAKKASEALVKAHKREIKALKEKYKNREISAENTLIKLYEKESKLVEALKKIDDDLAEKRKENENERLFALSDMETKIANKRVSGLNDYQKYLDAQKRKDAVYSKAKQALLDGDMDALEKYMKDYNKLIEVSAGEEIKVKEEVWQISKKTHRWEKVEIEKTKVSQRKTFAQYRKDAEKNRELINGYHKLKLAEINEEGAKERAIAVEKLKNIRSQIKSQIEYIKNLAKIAEIMTGIKPDLSFDESKKQLDEIQSQIDGIASEERHVKINVGAETSGAETKIKYYVDEQEKNPIKKKVELDKTEVSKDDAEIEEQISDPVFKKVGVDIDDAEKTLNTLKKEAETDTSSEHILEVADAYETLGKLQALEGETVTSKHNLDIADSLRKNNLLRTALGKPLPTLTQYIRQVVIPARQFGGLISKPVQKFNTGGHARKTGALAGYGGGDKIKALLEAGEFIIRKEAVRALGLARLHQINQGQIPKFQYGGMVGIPKFNTGGAVTQTSTASGKTVELNLNIGGNVYKTITDEDVANSLADYLQRSEF